MAQQGICECCSSEPAKGTTRTTDIEREVTCYCPIDGVIDTISKRHAMQIVAVLGAHGPMRYGEITDVLAVTSSSLFSERLAELVEEGLIERRSFDEVPPRVEYSLTPRGRELEERIQPLLEWASQGG
jgi:DNA-binding HxlR family transcriptional regulator